MKGKYCGREFNKNIADAQFTAATWRNKHITKHYMDPPCNSNNNNNDFFCANILEDQAQRRDKTKGLSKLAIENNPCVVNGWMKKLGS